MACPIPWIMDYPRCSINYERLLIVILIVYLILIKIGFDPLAMLSGHKKNRSGWGH